jgi:GntR family transcriptional repressor for pyruvate dehydrogenase complex
MIVPRFQLGHIVSRELKEAYYARIHTEHDTIVRAIERKIGAEARKAMREHLANSLESERSASYPESTSLMPFRNLPLNRYLGG